MSTPANASSDAMCTARGAGVGGWTIDVNHTLDSLNNLWLGDGTNRLEKLDGSKVISTLTRRFRCSSICTRCRPGFSAA